MLSPQELNALLTPDAPAISNDNAAEAPYTANDELEIFDIIVATDALIYALDRGSRLEDGNLGLRALREHLERLRHILSEE